MLRTFDNNMWKEEEREVEIMVVRMVQARLGFLGGGVSGLSALDWRGWMDEIGGKGGLDDLMIQ